MSEPTYEYEQSREWLIVWLTVNGTVEASKRFDAILSELDRRGQEIERREQENKDQAIRLNEARAEVARPQGELAEEKLHNQNDYEALWRADSAALAEARAERDRAQADAAKTHRFWSAACLREEKLQRALAAANAKLEAAGKLLRDEIPETSCQWPSVEKVLAILSAPYPGESVSVQEPEKGRLIPHSEDCICVMCDSGGAKRAQQERADRLRVPGDYDDE